MESKEVSGIFVLTPAASKRLIARGVAAMSEVRAAFQRGLVVIALGTTNAYVAEELTGQPLPKHLYSAGNITTEGFGSTREEFRHPPFVLIDGKPSPLTMAEALAEFTARDVFIKGANAVDPNGVVGILLGGGTGGTVGNALGTVTARGAHLVVPVGLEKLVPSVLVAARKCGQQRLTYPVGATLGLMPIVNATVVTEVEALRLLTGVAATHVASGGVGGGEGSVVLVVEGSDQQVTATLKLIEDIRKEPPLPSLGELRLTYSESHPSG